MNQNKFTVCTWNCRSPFACFIAFPFGKVNCYLSPSAEKSHLIPLKTHFKYNLLCMHPLISETEKRNSIVFLLWLCYHYKSRCKREKKMNLKESVIFKYLSPLSTKVLIITRKYSSVRAWCVLIDWLSISLFLCVCVCGGGRERCKEKTLNQIHSNCVACVILLQCSGWCWCCTKGVIIGHSVIVHISRSIQHGIESVHK